MHYVSPRNLGLTVVVVGALTLVTFANVRTQRLQVQEIPQPEHGVSFAGAFVQTEPDGSRWIGTIYRRADQSFAMYGTDSDGTRSTTMITIANAETLHSYLFREDIGYWVRVPLTAGPRKQRYRIKTREFNGLIPEAQSVAGFAVYREQQADGSFKLLAPDLNFFPVLLQSRSGLRREVFNIQFTEPDPALFLPPPDAKVVDGSGPQMAHPER